MPSEDNGAELLEPLEKQEMNDYYLFVTPGGMHHRLHHRLYVLDSAFGEHTYTHTDHRLRRNA